MCDKDKCSKIVEKVIEGNREVWITEDGTRWHGIEPQYTGPTGIHTADGRICQSGWAGSYLGSWAGF